MARLFNGTSDTIYAPLDLSPYGVVSLSYWGWWDSYVANSGENIIEFGDPGWTTAGFLCLPDFGATTFLTAFAYTETRFWGDTFTRPSTGVWHHYLHVFDRAGANYVWVDGVAQFLTTWRHEFTANTKFANSNLNLASRAHTSLFAACRLSEVALWPMKLGSAEARMLAAGATPLEVWPDRLLAYFPLEGNADNTEPVYGQLGKRLSTLATRVGTTSVAGPLCARPTKRRKVRVFA